jgi:hypothetical protein
MTTYILGAGASLHAGYPLAGQLGGALYDWISNKKPGHDLYRTRIEIIRDTYGIRKCSTKSGSKHLEMAEE